MALQHRQESQQLKEALRQEQQLRKETLRQQWLRRRRWIGMAVFMAVLMIFAGYMAHANWKAQQALLDATAMRLVAEGGSMTSGLRPGGMKKGLFKVLADTDYPARPILTKPCRLSISNSVN